MLHVIQQVDAAEQSDLVRSGLKHILDGAVSHVLLPPTAALALSR